MHSIKFRLILYFLLLIVLPIIITVSITYIFSNGIISRKIDESINNSIDEVTINVDDVLENAKAVSKVFILDNDFKTMLRKNINIDSSYGFSNLRNGMDLLSNLTKSSTGIDSIYVYDLNDNILFTSTRSISQDSSFSSSNIYNEAVKKGRDREWIFNKRNMAPFAVINDNLVTYAMPIKIYEEDLIVGYVYININENTIFKYLKRIRFNGSGKLVITNNKGEIISCEDKNLLGETMAFNLDYKDILSNTNMKFPLKIDNGNTLVFKKTSDISGLSYFAMVPVSNINRELIILLNIVLLVCGLTVCLAIVLSAFLTRSIYVPINRLVVAMEKLVFRRDFDYFINDKRKDEFGILYNSFNKMVKGMKQLFEQLFQEELKKKEAQLKFLQAQINPHFLYNTLYSIYCISKLHNVKEITELSYSLTNFFRISFSGGFEFITVREMLEQICHYLRIQNIRYKDSLELITDVDQELMDHNILKFLLQPLVENSITHGMKNKGGKGQIDITGYIANGNIKFTVSDNGFGIPQDKLESINNSLLNLSEEIEDGNSFALRNIHRRMKLYYGEKYGLSIFSNEGEGTVVEVILPYMKKAGEEDVQSVNC